MRRVPSLTSLEIDHGLADKLKARMTETNVTVVEGDGTKMPFPDSSLSGAVSFIMLHHVPSAALQDRLIAETFRVLKPGGAFAGADSIPSLRWNFFHLFDTRVPVDPEAVKEKDTRYKQFMAEHDGRAVELDALHPQTFMNILREGIEDCLDSDELERQKQIESEEREQLQGLVEKLDTILEE